MNTRVQWMMVIVIAATGARTALAVEADARANVCPRGQKTLSSRRDCLNAGCVTQRRSLLVASGAGLAPAPN